MESKAKFSGPPSVTRRVLETSDMPAFAMLPGSSPFWRFCSNLAACISAPPRRVPSRAHAKMFRSAHLRGGFPRQSLLTSSLLHVVFGTVLVSVPSLPDRQQNAAPEELSRSNQKIVWYTPSESLPPVAPVEEKQPAREEAEKSPPARKQSPAIHLDPAQKIVSKPPAPDNRRQTIIQPKAPELELQAELKLPNMIFWKPEVVPPAPSLTEVHRQLSQIGVPKLPVPKVAAPPPPVPPPLADLSLSVPQIEIASGAILPLPQLPVPEGAPSASPLEANQMPELPVPPALASEASPPGLRNLIAVSVAPAPPPPIEIRIPAGNRSGAFTVSPEGIPEPEIPSGNEFAVVSPPVLDGNELAAIRAPHLSISPASGGNPLDFPPLVMQTIPTPPRSLSARRPAPPPPRQDLTMLLAKATRPSLLPEMSRGRPAEPPTFFGSRRIHTLTINMPNLTSGSGSWVLRFAELNGNGILVEEEEEGLSVPVAVRKVDPQYSPAAIRDRVEGTVLLAAYILRDGTVSNIQVMNGLDPRLDESAMKALTAWEFRPATKNGIPVDLEVLIQIPFRLPVF